MARIDTAFKGVVYTRVGGTVHVLRAGDEVPAGASVGAHVLDASKVGVIDPEVPQDGGTPTGEDSGGGDHADVDYPGDDATREELNAYAEAIGMNPDEFKNKADLVAAIHQA